MRKKASGQILILILLVVVVALAIGLSVASKNLKNIRTSTQTEQSQRAFSTAEGGVEDVLARLNTIAADPLVKTTGYAETISVGSGLSANVLVKGSQTFEKSIPVGEVGQIDLNGVANPSQLTIEWGKRNLPNNAEGNPVASIEVSFVCANTYSTCITTPNTFLQLNFQHREALLGTTSLQLGQTGNWTSCPDSTSSEFYCKKTYTLSFINNRILRIRPLYNTTTIRVTSSDPNFPVQTYDVTSTADVQGVTRKVQVSRTALPQLPAVFDFGLFSETDIVK